MTFLQLAEKVIYKEKKPLTAEEIWHKGKKYKKTEGQTPASTIYSTLNRDIEKNPKTKFKTIGSNPVKFYLKKLLKEKIKNEFKDSMVGKNVGFIYILGNKAMEGLYKIGSSGRKDLDKRIKELYSTNVPFPFDCVFACEVENYEEVEKAIHTAFGDRRVNPNREFFRIDPDRITPLLERFRIKDTTKSISEKIDKTIDNVDKQAGIKYFKNDNKISARKIHVKADTLIENIYDEVSNYIKSLGKNISVKERQRFWSFKKNTKNFIGMLIQKVQLVLLLKLDPKTVKLEEGFTKDMSKIKAFTTGNLEVRIENKTDFEKAKPLIKRAYEEN